MDSTLEIMKKMLMNQIRRDLTRESKNSQIKTETKKPELKDKVPTKITTQTEGIKTARSSFPIKNDPIVTSKQITKGVNFNPISTLKKQTEVVSGKIVYTRQDPVLVKVSTPLRAGEKIPIHDNSKIRTDISNIDTEKKLDTTISIKTSEDLYKTGPPLTHLGSPNINNESTIKIPSLLNQYAQNQPRDIESSSFKHELLQNKSVNFDVIPEEKAIFSIPQTVEEISSQNEQDYLESIDFTEVKRIREETKNIQNSLDEVFNSDPDTDLFDPTPLSLNNADTKKNNLSNINLPFPYEKLNYLDEKYIPFLQKIAGLTEVTKDDFKAMVKASHLMYETTIVEINTWAEDNLNLADLLIEEEKDKIKLHINENDNF